MQRDVLGEREVEDQPSPLAVFRDVPQARVEALASGLVGDVLPTGDDAPGLRLAEARQRFDELRLAVPVDARDADDLAGPHLEGDAADALEAAVFEDAKILDSQERLTGISRLLLDSEEHVAPDHQAGEAFLGGALAQDGLDRLPATEDGDDRRWRGPRRACG